MLKCFIVILGIYLLIMIAVIVVVYGAWFISTQVSILMRKNQELAMQISLLNQENEQIMKRVQMLEQEKLDTEQKGKDS